MTKSLASEYDRRWLILAVLRVSPAPANRLLPSRDAE
jgi:hypothetical protein